jgi:predicted esterase YcpF (UPF0227 family)
MLIYIHGFNSSPASFKAGVIRRELERRGRGEDFLAPELPHSPAAAAALLDQLVRSHRNARVIGSSLGGYYATYLAERHALTAILINPSVRPYESLRGYLGRQKNLYTGEEYDFTAQHLAELRELDVVAIAPERYLLLVTTGDEVLDYRHAVEKYRGARQIVIEGGDHGFSDFARYLDTVLTFGGT